MAAKSRHWADVNNWLYEVINSCITPMQLLTAKKLVRLYEKMYPAKNPYDCMWATHDLLIQHCDARFNKILKEKIQNEKSRSNCPDGDISGHPGLESETGDCKK